MKEHNAKKFMIENDSKDAPPPDHINHSNDFLICPECFSSLEIISIDEDNNFLEFKCSKNNHENNKISITQFLKRTKKNDNLNYLNIFKDQCEIHKNNNYTCYCFVCKNHLCDECLQSGIHINHTKNNLIEIKPREQELKIISEFISEHKIKLEKLVKEKEIKTKELNEELKNKTIKEKTLLNNEIKLYNIKNNVELEQNNKKYISGINEIKKKYNEEIKKLKMKFEEKNNKTNNKYKLKKEKQIVKYNLKIEKLNSIYKNKLDMFQFELKIENTNNIVKLNENVFNLYKLYNNNYFNAMNINNILMSYINNKSTNEKMKKILGNDYGNLINIIKNKYDEGIHIIKKINEIEDLKNKIELESLKSKELSEMNIELSKNNEKKEKENNILNEQIKQINETLIKTQNENEEENIKHSKEKRELNQIILEKDEKIMEKEEEFNKIKNSLNKYQKYFKEEMKEIDIFQKQNAIINFKEPPNKLNYAKKLVTDRRNTGLLKNIAVYSKQNVGYLVYQSMNYNLIVMRINDNKIISNLIGHKIGIGFIRYYHNKNRLDNEEEYILSGDGNKLVIIWDINNNFNKKYSIQENYKETIFDALLLFNLYNKNYILLSSDNQHNYNEYTKLYELDYTTPFVKNVYNTNKNKNAFLIPWLYKNKYYVIACCDYEISINNIFEDENYANLILKPEGGHYSGFLYNDNYLCVSDINNNFLRIWDLVKKNVYKTIYFDDTKFGFEMVQWNDKYTIIGCDQCLIIVDIEKGKEVKKIEGNNGKIFGVKKIDDDEFGECLICSEENNTISIYMIKDGSVDEKKPIGTNEDDSEDFFNIFE